MNEKERAVMEQALELLGTWEKPPARLYRVMDNLRAALAQEPVGEVLPDWSTEQEKEYREDKRKEENEARRLANIKKWQEV